MDVLAESLHRDAVAPCREDNGLAEIRRTSARFRVHPHETHLVPHELKEPVLVCVRVCVCVCEGECVWEQK